MTTDLPTPRLRNGHRWRFVQWGRKGLWGIAIVSVLIPTQAQQIPEESPDVSVLEVVDDAGTIQWESDSNSNPENPPTLSYQDPRVQSLVNDLESLWIDDIAADAPFVAIIPEGQTDERIGWLYEVADEGPRLLTIDGRILILTKEALVPPRSLDLNPYVLAARELEEQHRTHRQARPGLQTPIEPNHWVLITRLATMGRDSDAAGILMPILDQNGSAEEALDAARRRLGAFAGERMIHAFLRGDYNRSEALGERVLDRFPDSLTCR